ncbi:MAG TPA: hypothetical protein VER79_14410 [Candidatus Limnocylindrales bacterium]|nr:hypothetical protein [Candidatus Limnocylindrales bacterium]
MTPARRTYPLAGFVLLLIAVYMLLLSLGLVPAGIQDLVGRAWPALLVLAGLSIVLRGRVPFSRLIAVAITAVAAVGIGLVAFQSQASQPSQATQQAIQQAIAPDLALLRVRVNLIAADVQVLSGLTAEIMKGQFTGSAASRIDVTYVESADRSGTLTITEMRPEGLPPLDQLGRGVLELELPPDVPLDVQFVGADGNATFNLNDVALERLNVDATGGDLVVTLPAYQPQLVPQGETNGTLTAATGSLTLFVPSSVAARLELNRGGSGIEPQFDPAQYNYLVGDVLESRTIDTAPFYLTYTLNAPHGLIRVESLQG